MTKKPYSTQERVTTFLGLIEALIVCWLIPKPLMILLMALLGHWVNPIFIFIFVLGFTSLVIHSLYDACSIITDAMWRSRK